ncbi:MAG: hypothetical protein HXY40_15990 [Chloroflexi bacterium]|nr:hypothetical protein [Chloroflexota bacterium]
MPFFDDSDPRIEEERTPLERAFAILRDQLERMVALNLLWVAQGLPLLLAWAFPLPDFLRLTFTLYSALAFPPVTATLFAVLWQVSTGAAVDRYLIGDCFRQQLKPGLLKLMPLYSLFFWLAALALFAEDNGWLLLDVLARLLLLLTLLVSLYWGPLLVAQPAWPLSRLAARAVRLFWLHPAHTLLLALVCLAALFLGIVSIAGLALIVPILVMLLQTEFYRAVAL